jgi:hypothetical protein
MTAKDNSWAAAAEVKLNATYARHIQRTGDQPRALVSELGPDRQAKPRYPRSDRVSGVRTRCLNRVKLRPRAASGTGPLIP